MDKGKVMIKYKSMKVANMCVCGLLVLVLVVCEFGFVFCVCKRARFGMTSSSCSMWNVCVF